LSFTQPIISALYNIPRVSDCRSKIKGAVLFGCRSGFRLGPVGNVATNGTIVPAPDDRWVWNIGGIIGRRKLKNSEIEREREREREKKLPHLLIFPP
jgi:hypothetical protein